MSNNDDNDNNNDNDNETTTHNNIINNDITIWKSLLHIYHMIQHMTIQRELLEIICLVTCNCATVKCIYKTIKYMTDAWNTYCIILTWHLFAKTPFNTVFLRGWTYFIYIYLDSSDAAPVKNWNVLVCHPCSCFCLIAVLGHQQAQCWLLRQTVFYFFFAVSSFLVSWNELALNWQHHGTPSMKSRKTPQHNRVKNVCMHCAW